MKLVSVNAVLLVSTNCSLFLNAYLDTKMFPPVSLFFLSLIYICLIILLQYEHRQFKKQEININESSSLFKKHLFLFGAGLAITLAQKMNIFSEKQCGQLNQYVLLVKSIHYSLMYYSLNLGLGLSYLFLFQEEYRKANRNRLEFEIASGMVEENCSICLLRIGEGQKIGKIECLHLFHLTCLNKWIKKKETCPLCLNTITTTG